MSVTFMLTCYNQAKFIREAVRGAFAQDYQPLEVLISDNHSTDGTLEIVQEEISRYAGPHTVRLLTSNENIGPEVFAKSVEAARGTFIIGAHGDDISFPGRTSSLARAWQSTGASLVASNAQVINEESQVVELMNAPGEAVQVSATTFAEKGFSRYAHGACLAWHRDVFEKFPRLGQERLRGHHDHVLPFRATLLNGHYYIAEPLLQWRRHPGNFGAEAADWTKDAIVAKETGAGYDLAVRICMLDDLDDLISRKGESPELIQLRTNLLDGLLKLTRHWSKLRNRLFADDWRPTWVASRELEQHPDYDKGYGRFTKKKEKGLRKLRRKLARALKL